MEKKEKEQEQSLSSQLVSIALAFVMLLLSMRENRWQLPALALIASLLPLIRTIIHRKKQQFPEDPGERYLHRGKETDPWDRPDKPFPRRKR